MRNWRTILSDKRVKLYFALLNNGWVRREFASRQLNEMRTTEGVEFVWENPALTWGHPICSNRNAIVMRFLKTDCDFLMMQDDDIVPLHNPAELVFADKDVVGSPAKVRTGQGTVDWVAYVKTKIGGQEGYVACDMANCPSGADLVAVDVVGTGLICVKRKVIETLGPGCFLDTFDKNGLREFGTDFAFCHRAKAAGFEVFTTPFRVCEHIKEQGMLETGAYDDSDNLCLDNYPYNIAWGGMAILQKDWRFIKDTMEKNGVKNVLEFGAGLSSLLMSEKVPVVTYETDAAWAKEIEGRKNGNQLAIAMWDGRESPLLAQRGPFDMAFVDGPRGGDPGREASIRAVAEARIPLVICHDAGRRDETEFQNRYLRNDYDITGINGHHLTRCQLWTLRQ